MNETKLQIETRKQNITFAITAVREKAKKVQVEFTCQFCGKTELLPQSVATRRGGKKYCSWECRNKAMKGKNAPNYGNSKGIVKEKNPNWKGGISEERKGRKLIAEQSKWRRAVFYRDQYICQRCGYDKGKILNAHHIKPWAEFTQDRFDLSNGITLCKPCHDWVHSSKNTNNELLCRS